VRGELERLRKTFVRPSGEANAVLAKKGSNPLEEAVSLDKLLKRPELSYDDIRELGGSDGALSARVREQVEIECKYEGYLRRQEAEVSKFNQMEEMHIPSDFPYDRVPGLSIEVRQKLSTVRPVSIGQASRIPGMTPAAISVLMVYLKRFRELSGDVESAA